MSRLAQVIELKALRQEVADLKQHQAERERVTENLITCVGELRMKLEQLEAKRPGRPRKDE